MDSAQNLQKMSAEFVKFCQVSCDVYHMHCWKCCRETTVIKTPSWGHHSREALLVHIRKYTLYYVLFYEDLYYQFGNSLHVDLLFCLLKSRNATNVDMPSFIHQVFQVPEY